MRARGIEPNSYVFTNLVHTYAVARDMRGALSCVDEMKTEGIELAVVTYSILIGDFANINDAESADNMFVEAKQKIMPLNAIIYSNIIYMLIAKRGNMARAEELVRDMEGGIDAPIDLYHTMMDGYTNVRNEEKRLIVFEKLKECGFTPSVISYGCLINLYTKMDKAVEVIDKMVLAGIAPSEHTYTTIMEGYASVGDTGKAFEHFTKIKEGGLKLDVYTNEASLKACCKRATKAVEEMEAVGVKPNIKTYTTLVWARTSLPEKALRCFEDMKLAGLKPDKAAYHCLMTSLLSRAAVAEEYIYSGILGVCKEMLEHALTVDMRTAVHWSKCLRKIERSGRELTEALQKTSPPDWNSHEVSTIISYRISGNKVNSDGDSDVSEYSEDEKDGSQEEFDSL